MPENHCYPAARYIRDLAVQPIRPEILTVALAPHA